MRTIWKYIIDDITKVQVWQLSENTQFLTLQLQNGVPTAWFLVDPTKLQSRVFAIIGTGHEVPNNSQYLATWQDSPFVWHLFELF